MASIEVLVNQLRARYGGGSPQAPARRDQIVQAEARLGFSIPGSLRHLYIDFSNGGFGPSFGVYGVGPGAYVHEDGLDLVGQYVEHRHPHGATLLTEADPEYTLWTEGWPEKFLPLTAPAGTLSYVLDSSTGEVFSADGNDVISGMTHSEWFQLAAPSVEAWLGRWLAGEFV